MEAFRLPELPGVGQSLQETAFQRVPAARAQLVRFVASTPKAAEELHQPLLLAVCFGFRLDCLQAPLVRSALRATIGPRPDATPRALTAGLLFSRSFFNRLDWHSHSRPPRFNSPIVPLMGTGSIPFATDQESFSFLGAGVRRPVAHVAGVGLLALLHNRLPACEGPNSRRTWLPLVYPICTRSDAPVRVYCLPMWAAWAWALGKSRPVELG